MTFKPRQQEFIYTRIYKNNNNTDSSFLYLMKGPSGTDQMASGGYGQRLAGLLNTRKRLAKMPNTFSTTLRARDGR